MTADEYRDALNALDLSQVGAARLFGVNDRTSRRWAAGEDIPKAVDLALRLMLRSGDSAESIAQILIARLELPSQDREPVRFRWVSLRKHAEPQWTIAERRADNPGVYWLPGEPQPFRGSEVILGPVVEPLGSPRA